MIGIRVFVFNGLAENLEDYVNYWLSVTKPKVILSSQTVNMGGGKIVHTVYYK